VTLFSTTPHEKVCWCWVCVVGPLKKKKKATERGQVNLGPQGCVGGCKTFFCSCKVWGTGQKRKNPERGIGGGGGGGPGVGSPAINTSKKLGFSHVCATPTKGLVSTRQVGPKTVWGGQGGTGFGFLKLVGQILFTTPNRERAVSPIPRTNVLAQSPLDLKTTKFPSTQVNQTREGVTPTPSPDHEKTKGEKKWCHLFEAANQDRGTNRFYLVEPFFGEKAGGVGELGKKRGRGWAKA